MRSSSALGVSLSKVKRLKSEHSPVVVMSAIEER